MKQNSWQCQVSGLTELRRKQKQEKTQKIGPEKKYRNEVSIKIGNCNWSEQIYVHVKSMRSKLLGAWSAAHETVCEANPLPAWELPAWEQLQGKTGFIPGFWRK